MNRIRAEFSRMVLGLPQSRADYAGVRATAELAELLGLNLVATFVEDASLVEMASLPGMRELRPLGGGWRPIELSQLTRELERAAQAAQRLFVETIAPHN